MREILEVYRPGAPPVADEFLDELHAAVDWAVSGTMRPVRGELGWSFDFPYFNNFEPFPSRERRR